MSKHSQQKELIHQIRQSSRQLVRELDVVKGVYLDTGYTFSQCHVLFELSSHQSLTLMELAEILLINKSNASRTVKQLIAKGLVKSTKGKTDSRQKFFSLTAAGKKALQETINLADDQVADALANLAPDQQQAVAEGLHFYQAALRKGRLQEGYSIRPIKRKDNPAIATIIRNVMTEFGAVGEGYSIGDAEVDDMYSNYRDDRSCYFVISDEEGQVYGGGGIGPLKGGTKTICELRKMFFKPQLRGIGMGRRLVLRLLQEAKARGYRKCYLETLDRMGQANALYQKCGFELLQSPEGKTGHCACDRYYVRSLATVN